MFTYEDMKSNHETIKEFCTTYRRELTKVGAVLCEKAGLASCSDYEKFMNGLDTNEFVGNYLTALLDPYGIDNYRAVLNGEKSFNDFVELYFGKEIMETLLD